MCYLTGVILFIFDVLNLHFPTFIKLFKELIPHPTALAFIKHLFNCSNNFKEPTLDFLLSLLRAYILFHWFWLISIISFLPLSLGFICCSFPCFTIILSFPCFLTYTPKAITLPLSTALTASTGLLCVFSLSLTILTQWASNFHQFHSAFQSFLLNFKALPIPYPEASEFCQMSWGGKHQVCQAPQVSYVCLPSLWDGRGCSSHSSPALAPCLDEAWTLGFTQILLPDEANVPRGKAAVEQFWGSPSVDRFSLSPHCFRSSLVPLNRWLCVLFSAQGRLTPSYYIHWAAHAVLPPSLLSFQRHWWQQFLSLLMASWWTGSLLRSQLSQIC